MKLPVPRWAGVLAVALFAAVAGVACSDSPDDSEDDAAVETSAPATTNLEADDQPASTPEPEPEPAEVEPSDQLVIRPADNEGTSGDQSWIGTSEMTDDAITVVWDLAADLDGSATGDVAYRLYRIATDDLAAAGWESPEEAVLTGDELLYEIPDGTTTFSDDGAETGAFYTYFLVGLVAGQDTQADGPEVVTRRWTTGLARTDIEPPTPIENLNAEVTEDGVLLTWDPSTDNIEFAAYSVSLVNDDGSTTYLGGGADPSLTNFVDDRPEGPSATYRVEAVDFHNNRSESAETTVELP